jgi:hypothetical protein
MTINKLHPNWITEGSIDFEYKKYILLAYLQYVKSNFSERKLYPPLSEILEHYHHSINFQKSIRELEEKFPKTIVGINLKKMQLMTEKLVGNNDALQTLNEIIEFAIPNFITIIEEGKDLFELVEQSLLLEPVGLLPMYKSEGYMLLNHQDNNEVRIYRYQLSHLTLSDEKYHSLSFRYVNSETKSISNSIEQIKINLIKTQPELPNPATYYCFSKLHMPLQETLLPVSKRLLLRKLNDI